MSTPRDVVEIAEREYGLHQQPDGTFHSTRGIYRAGDVISALRSGKDEHQRLDAMMALKSKGRLKAEAQA